MVYNINRLKWSSIERCSNGMKFLTLKEGLKDALLNAGMEEFSILGREKRLKIFHLLMRCS